jgi:hypothetical protein
MTVDALLLGALLLAANFLLGREDAGWRWLNPTPYIALPLLLGGRYGFAPGLAGGIFADLLMLGAVLTFGSGDSTEFITSRSFTFIALPVVGIAAGEIHRVLSDKGSNLQAANASLQEEASRLARQLEVARDTQHDLQRQLALHGAEYCSLELELNRLFRPDAGPLLSNVLNLLSHFTGLTDAAFYRVGTPSTLEARIGDAQALPDQLKGKDAPIVQAALRSGKLATARGLWKSTPEVGDRFLAALPLGIDGKRVLLIHRMPFLSVNWHTFARIEMICQWVAMMEKGGGAGSASLEVDRERFNKVVDLAINTAATHGLPSAVLVVCAAVLGTIQTAELKALATPVLKGSEILRAGDTPEPHLAILLPLEGKREADALADRLIEAAATLGTELRLRHLPVNGEEAREELAAL